MLQGGSVAIEDVDILVKAYHSLRHTTKLSFHNPTSGILLELRMSGEALPQDLDLIMNARRNYRSEIRAFTLSDDVIAD